MCIPCMSHLKSTKKAIEVQLTHRISKPIVDKVMDENYTGSCSDLIDCTTLILSIDWCQILSACVGNNFLGCSVVLDTSIAIRISNVPCMMSDLIVIANGSEHESTFSISKCLIITLEFLSSTNVREILR
jgi:hypothetical protein